MGISTTLGIMLGFRVERYVKGFGVRLFRDLGFFLGLIGCVRMVGFMGLKGVWNFRLRMFGMFLNCFASLLGQPPCLSIFSLLATSEMLHFAP